MRILFLSPFPSAPLYGGAVVRNHYLSRSLAQRHEVVASFCGLSGDEHWLAEVPLAGPGWRALFDPRFLWKACQAIRTYKIEAIVASSLIAGLHGLFLKWWCGLPFWIDEHNVEWHCAKRAGLKSWPLIYLLEAFILWGADYVTCVSNDDRTRLMSSFGLVSTKVVVASNGVDLKHFQAPYQSEEGPDFNPRDASLRKVLFFGVLNYAPNRQAVLTLSREIAPVAPDFITFLVAGVGGDDLPELCPNLNFLGFVDDIHTLIRDCDGVIVPISAGGGTRMKILEAVACGRPVLSTTLGAEGLDRGALGASLTVADDLETMCAWLKALPLRSQAQVGASFEDLYDWESIWARSEPWQTNP